MLINLENKTVLDLQPLIFWDHCIKHPDSLDGHCYIYDIKEKDKEIFSYKAAGQECSKSVSIGDAETSPLAENMLALIQKDPQFEVLTGIELIEVQKLVYP